MRGPGPWVDDALGAERLLRLVNELRLSPFSLPRDGVPAPAAADSVDMVLPAKSTVAGGTLEQHDVRERLVAVLLKLARARAVTPLALPQVVVQNLGVRDQIDLPDLRTRLQGAYWDRLGKSITLRAVVRHHVGALALETYCGQVDGLLRQISEVGDLPWDLRPLDRLPARAGADLEAPVHLRNAIRFRADEERVLDLLMGRNLYKNPELAVRELYQNAMDACRHRDLRTRYLRRMGADLPPWEGAITFTQGIDADGRRYLRCHDNGIGMGENEIRNAFTEAGARFVHLPEFVREMALWQQHAPDLKLYPNSRFGIGVLSYFMLADEITVETCRFGMDGRLGQALRVSIAGPGTLFRIDPLPDDPRREAGTTVTLYLNPPENDELPVSCLHLLEEQLWVAPYRTVVSAGGRTAVWEPNELRVEALQQHQEPSVALARSRRTEPTVAKVGDGKLYWVGGKGVLLADGIKTDQDRFGVVVDLRDELRPELLSVDRLELQRYDEEAVERLELAALPELVTSPVFTDDWVLQVAESDDRLAVACVRHAAAAEITWEYRGHRMPVAASGVFLPDELLLYALTAKPLRPSEPWGDDTHLFVSTMPEYIVRWRLLALLRGGVGVAATEAVRASEPVTAVPTDLRVLMDSAGDSNDWTRRRRAWARNGLPRMGLDLEFRPDEALLHAGMQPIGTLPQWRAQQDAVDLGVVFTCVQDTGSTVAEVTERLSALGLPVAPLPVSGHLGPEDLPYLTGLTGPWLLPDSPVSWPEVLYAAAGTRTTVAETAQRLRQLGYSVQEPRMNRTDLGETDKRLLSEVFAGPGGKALVHGSEPVCVARITGAAASLSWSPAAVAERLTELGIDIATDELQTTPLDDNDRLIISMDLDGVAPFLTPEQPLSPAHVIGAANVTGLSVREVTDRLRAHGVLPPDVEPPWSELSATDLLLLSQGFRLGRPGRFLLPGQPVTRLQVLDVADRLNIPVADARRRLAELGHPVPAEHPVLDRLHPGDCRLIAPYLPDHGADSIPATHVRAAAERLGRPAAEVAEDLAALGCLLEEPPEPFLMPNAGERLAALLFGAEAAEGAGDGDVVSLSDLAALALRLRRPFREVALEASRLGFRHGAEDWFPETAGSPATESAADPAEVPQDVPSV
ncbi:hypothetical protein ABZ202_15255 [Streptomyces sp. NPDC006186]|uniref:wHTH domain-containing protein n=1 Tax=Streptomyces sp. NPDC006186 TaxID=3155248 RepID=UPI0033B28D03